jgi:HEPN domain-containing protein
MGTPRDIDARRYYRVAYQRLEDGALMLDKLDRPKAAVYLAGYASECILKALLLVVTPLPERAEVLRSFRGAAAHDLLGLRSRLRARCVTMPMRVAKELAYVASWSVDLRYEPGIGDRDDAQRFIAATRSILAWADERM